MDNKSAPMLRARRLVESHIAAYGMVPHPDKLKEAIATAEDRRYMLLLTAFSELQAAAQKVADETDRIHDNEPWPVKYRAPYGAIVELRQLLAKQYGLRG